MSVLVEAISKATLLLGWFFIGVGIAVLYHVWRTINNDD